MAWRGPAMDVVRPIYKRSSLVVVETVYTVSTRARALFGRVWLANDNRVQRAMNRPIKINRQVCRRNEASHTQTALCVFPIAFPTRRGENEMKILKR